MRPRRTPLAVALALSSLPVSGVMLSPNGYGQALIYPYYTVRTSEGGNALNTYISLGNSTDIAKAVRVRVREGRAGREVLSLNVYLSPNDVWTAAMVPTDQGARLLTVDTSCTDPPFSAQFDLPFSATGYTGANADGLGDTLDRTREGFVEIIEMATLSGASAAAVTHNAAGTPANCAAIRAPASPPSVGPPSGGLWGGLTLINVNSGQDFTLEAIALDRLASRPFFQRPGGAGPDFNAPEIDPVSVVVDGDSVYRATWNRPVDAVSAVLTRSQLLGEYVLEANTRSQTDLVITMPTRHHYVDGQPLTFVSPFTAGAACSAGEAMLITFFNREERGAVVANSDPSPIYMAANHCAAAGVATVHNNSVHTTPQANETLVLGSETRGLFAGTIRITTGFQTGWLHVVPTAVGASMTSTAQSTRHQLATGTTTTGAQTYAGLPMLGFVARTFSNGTLTCTGGRACQGNYGGAFPLRYRTRIESP